MGLWARIVAMLKDGRTWTTLAYFILMLPLGIVYFVIAVIGLSVGVAFTVAPVAGLMEAMGLFDARLTIEPAWLAAALPLGVMCCIGVVVLTTLMHAARAIGRAHARMAKRLLVTPG